MKSIRPLDTTERQIFKEAEKSGYLLRRSREPDIGDVWYEWCQRHNIPCLVIDTRRKYADLWVDLFPTDHDYSKEAEEVIKALLELIPSRRWSVGRVVWCDEFPICMSVSLAHVMLNFIAIDRKLKRLPRSLRQ